MKVNFVVYNNCLNPVDEPDIKWVQSQGAGTLVQGDFKKVRSVKHHRKFWGLCRIVSENSEVYTSAEMVADICKLKMGLVDYRVVIGGEVIIKTKSIAFENMDQNEFKVFYEGALLVLSELSGISTYDLDKNNA